jgi:hypothetical protein
MRMRYETRGKTVDRLSAALWIVLAVGFVTLAILINSKLLPRAEPSVTAEAETHYALIESLDW